MRQPVSQKEKGERIGSARAVGFCIFGVSEILHGEWKYVREEGCDH